MSQKKSAEKFVEHEVQALLELEKFIASNPDPRELKRAASIRMLIEGIRHEKLLLLYWLKTKTVDSVLSAAVRLGKHRTTIQRWLSSYRTGGIEELLCQKPRAGRPRIMTPEIVEKLSEELNQVEGFSSYKEVHQWLTSCCDIPVAYRTVHQWARYRLKGKLKVPRRRE
jgi:transposase